MHILYMSLRFIESNHHTYLFVPPPSGTSMFNGGGLGPSPYEIGPFTVGGGSSTFPFLSVVESSAGSPSPYRASPYE